MVQEYIYFYLKSIVLFSVINMFKKKIIEHTCYYTPHIYILHMVFWSDDLQTQKHTETFPYTHTHI